MRLNRHSELVGRHAFLSASKSSWLNYDDDKIDRVFLASMAAQRGTDLHALAAELIRLGVKLPDTPTTMNLYVNDCIGFRMTPEQPVFYSPNCFGTADALAFRKMKLRIADLKTGVLEAKPRQLEVYAAIFCLEYNLKPFDFETELRIYQSNEVRIYDADPVDIALIMDKIINFDKRIASIREDIE